MGAALHDAVSRIENLLVVSPHFHDAVFSCGNIIAAYAGSTVLTVFAGQPPDGSACTAWDQRCGFAQADQAWRARCSEDDAAIRLLSARHQRLPFVDAQYGQAVEVDDVSMAVAAHIDRLAPSALVFPLGLFHSDHLLTHAACMRARRPGQVLMAYEDALYRRMPGFVQERLLSLANEGIRATPVSPHAADGSLKREAVECYASQLRALGSRGYDDLAQPERYWALEYNAEALAVAGSSAVEGLL